MWQKLISGSGLGTDFFSVGYVQPNERRAGGSVAKIKIDVVRNGGQVAHSKQLGVGRAHRRAVSGGRIQCIELKRGGGIGKQRQAVKHGAGGGRLGGARH